MDNISATSFGQFRSRYEPLSREVPSCVSVSVRILPVDLWSHGSYVQGSRYVKQQAWRWEKKQPASIFSMAVHINTVDLIQGW